MRSVYQATAQDRLQKTARARQFVSDRFTWARVAERHWGFCRTVLAGRSKPVAQAGATIGFVTTWNVKCGIAEYTRYLATSLPSGHGIAVFANRSLETVRADEDFVLRCWDTQHAARPQEEVD